RCFETDERYLAVSGAFCTAPPLARTPRRARADRLPRAPVRARVLRQALPRSGPAVRRLAGRARTEPVRGPRAQARRGDPGNEKGCTRRNQSERAWSIMAEPVRWSDEAQEVISGDITTAAAYLTPAGGAVVTAVATFGIADRDRGMVGFTTSLGFP